ncbi:MAG: histidine triad nucleotide-binding protein [Candidatus Kerfeldbacteria bacterium RIFCSPHIGHO2_02_FULL_42_14]|uniref:Histidine triad nucleotide-binding protein n=1 Tax=Candidatus Kerfeldbacteria bacterium RIFCSPHIGHO2_02_FULL_42_14 TaxID=1798540 RepID=A0A1G2AQV0_9BACT|nr:MAG: histidine triad nucleotide-binding protein [Candidatus Kerfeldbacteria bacterium RIFCSPHIGHO2_02_FULL_42_14]OGY81281.1 MAG: histidine triad nucleotide-binding protein [Candidatus Kerfeldbacteria bacterium RIFCSPHIGHO2_12_FULL_42_13]OGY83556.1 MAG: histidine triad nucleotide-binding protein [Candidatus Kerfeldbacteria bacterium RIFCSPLOWO2_02_FULL_42_19]OGY87413.1 MAG: histidine triad nucleotide-binding protein [Candidatus Kerfeldbacteria bacterium RIFCSPLOWO2_12_FULL_43_9]
MTDCLFCKIVNNQIPAEKTFEDKNFLAFKDIHPKAPTHILVIPKKHITSLADMHPGDAPLIGQLMHRVALIAEQVGIAEKGYKVVLNIREHGGQVIPHIHVHLLGGKALHWEV